jgi:hypothetical protein
MSGQTVILVSDTQRDFAKRLIDMAPQNAVVNIKERKRSNEQNALMWVLLSDVSRAKPQGLTHSTDLWKCLFMEACGHEVQFMEGLNGRPFPVGHQSSKLTVPQMRDLIEFIYAWGSENGVQFSEKPIDRNAA